MGHVFAEGQIFEKKCLVLRSRVFQIFVPWPWRSKCFKVLIIAVVFLLCSENVEKQWAPSFIYRFFLNAFFPAKERHVFCFVKYVSVCCEAFRFAEFFAGEAAATMALKQWGLAGIAFDYNFGGRYNNFFEPSGFAFPAQFIYHFLLNHSKNYASI